MLYLVGIGAVKMQMNCYTSSYDVALMKIFKTKKKLTRKYSVVDRGVFRGVYPGAVYPGGVSRGVCTPGHRGTPLGPIGRHTPDPEADTPPRPRGRHITDSDSDSKPNGYVVLCRTCSHCTNSD